MRYVNHFGSTFDFDAPGIYTHRDAIRDYSWSITLLNGRVSSASRAEATLSLVVNFAMDPEGCEEQNKAALQGSRCGSFGGKNGAALR